MPEISHLFGAIITMYYNDRPPPHFHVRYNQQKAIFDIQSLEIIAGQLSPRLYKLVQEWATIYQSELMENWEIARNNEPLNKIEP